VLGKTRFKPRLTTISVSLMVLAIAVATQLGLGLYKLYIGCPRAFTDCYVRDIDTIFWPQVLSILALYLMLPVLLVSISKRATCWILQRIRRGSAS
tara:strand:+ start:17613 stop:17900 length:288 start_codon:yes stop_codon:yes gene_type:complete